MVAKLKQKEIHFIAFSKNSLTFYFFQGKSVIRFSYVVKSQCAFSVSHLLLCLLSLQLIFAVRLSHGLIPPFRLNFRRSSYNCYPITLGRLNLAGWFDSSLDLQISSFRFSNWGHCKHSLPERCRIPPISLRNIHLFRL